VPVLAMPAVLQAQGRTERGGDGAKPVPQQRLSRGSQRHARLRRSVGDSSRSRHD
jgi:hypothetical protein